MKRLLCIVGSLNQGGAETFLMKLLRQADKNEYMLDFCVMSEEKGKYEEEILRLGGKIYHTVPKSKNPLKCFNNIRKTVKDNGYKSVIRVNEHSLSVTDLIAARCGGAKKLVMRSSNANSPSKKMRVLHKMFFFLPRIVPGVKIAPSTEAAEYTFGKRAVKKGKVKILKNGLPLKDFAFDENVRREKRKELNTEGKTVIGHVGRFDKQKNHSFLLDIFEEILKKDKNAVLVTVGGSGALENEIKEKARAMNIADKVCFLGSRTDVPALLSSFDVLVFPSFYEGMPNVVIEAQAAALPCVISDTVTREAALTDLAKYVSLEKSAAFWAEEALLQKDRFVREKYKGALFEKGYDIETVTNEFLQTVF